MKPIKTDDLDAPWFVLEETDEAFSDVTNRMICYRSDFGPAQISLNSSQIIPQTWRRRRMAYLMAAAPMLYTALWELTQLLEQRNPSWYERRHHNLAVAALSSAELPNENRKDA